MLDLTIVNRGKRIDTFTLVNSLMTGAELGIEFDGRIEESDKSSLYAMIATAKCYLRDAMTPLLVNSKFTVVIIGAEIDEDSESLWLWLDDPENPL